MQKMPIGLEVLPNPRDRPETAVHVVFHAAEVHSPGFHGFQKVVIHTTVPRITPNSIACCEEVALMFTS
jgi:hypothetical protein